MIVTHNRRAGPNRTKGRKNKKTKRRTFRNSCRWHWCGVRTLELNSPKSIYGETISIVLPLHLHRAGWRAGDGRGGGGGNSQVGRLYRFSPHFYSFCLAPRFSSPPVCDNIVGPHAGYPPVTSHLHRHNHLLRLKTRTKIQLGQIQKKKLQSSLLLDCCQTQHWVTKEVCYQRHGLLLWKKFETALNVCSFLFFFFRGV